MKAIIEIDNPENKHRFVIWSTHEVFCGSGNKDVAIQPNARIFSSDSQKDFFVKLQNVIANPKVNGLG